MGPSTMFRVTIRELLLLTALFGAGLAAIKYAGEWTVIVISNGVPCCLMVATVMALVARGRRQATASGFASCLAIYLALLLCTTTNQRYRWATEKLLVRLHKAMMTQTWVDRRTGQEVAYDPQWRVIGLPANVGGKQLPEAGYFKAIGHLLWALVFGYLGSRFAAWLYARRQTVDARAGPVRSEPTAKQ